MRKRVKLPLLPVFLNFTQRGLSSIGVKILGWSWNSQRPGRSRVDLPGPFHAELGGDRPPTPWRRSRNLLALLITVVAVIAGGVDLGLWAAPWPLAAIGHGLHAAVAFTARIL